MDNAPSDFSQAPRMRRNSRLKSKELEMDQHIAPTSCEELTSIALSLRDRVGLNPEQRFRLVGVGLSNFCDPEEGSAQSALFA